MNNLFRSAARCLRSGSAVCVPRQTDGRSQWASVRLLCSAADLQKNLGEMVKKDKVVVFMKGTPAQPMCGFSNAVVQILRMHGVDNYAAYNVLEDQDLRQVDVAAESITGQSPVCSSCQAPRENCLLSGQCQDPLKRNIPGYLMSFFSFLNHPEDDRLLHTCTSRSS
uniref:Glutaredoxin domain-containing protein n=1 Tax=Oreochromis aureus TaxID=47969 RepID=A0AAZ1Y517_OREAU